MSRLDNRLDHRLDDELRNAFRREQPSADFTSRVLERVAVEPPPRLSLWQKLAMLLEPSTLRWVAIGVTASLLLAIGAIEYSRLHQGVVNEKETSASPTQEASTPGTDQLLSSGNEKTASKRVAPFTAKHRPALARHQEREMRAEGEAAKEKLMLALAIASSALSDAQKAVHDDGPQP